ncbi:MAG: transposase [Sphaerochaeta sp.]
MASLSPRIENSHRGVEFTVTENDLAQYGNKYRATGEMQVSLLMAYDIGTRQPVLSRLYPGGMPDKTSVKDLLAFFSFTGKLIVADRGFHSPENLLLFTNGGNHYIIPLSENLLEYKRSFIYRTKKKMHPIFYWEAETAGEDGSRVILYKDMNRSAEEEEAFRKRIGTSKGYTPERLEALKGSFGALILITGQIEEAFRSVCPKIQGKTPDDILWEARGVKIRKRNNIWEAANYSKKLIELFAHFECPIIGDLNLVT